MATINDRFFDSGNTVKRAWRVSFTDRIGNRRCVQFRDEETARYFYAEVKKKEDRWRAERVLSTLEIGAQQ